VLENRVSCRRKPGGSKYLSEYLHEARKEAIRKQAIARKRAGSG